MACCINTMPTHNEIIGECLHITNQIWILGASTYWIGHTNHVMLAPMLDDSFIEAASHFVPVNINLLTAEKVQRVLMPQRALRPNLHSAVTLVQSGLRAQHTLARG